MDTVSDRLIYLIRDIYKVTPLSFSQKYNDAKGVKTYNILRGRNGISNKMLDMITKAYPDINPVWLLTGEGTPLRETSRVQSIIGNNNIQTGGNLSHQKDNSVTDLLRKQLSDYENRIVELERLLKEKDVQIGKLLDIISNSK